MSAPVDWDRYDAEAFPPVGPTVELPPYLGPPEELRSGRPRRTAVRPRPSARYDSPEELWAWHWARMRVTAAWTVVATLGSVCGTTAVIFFAELVW